MLLVKRQSLEGLKEESEDYLVNILKKVLKNTIEVFWDAPSILYNSKKIPP